LKLPIYYEIFNKRLKFWFFLLHFERKALFLQSIPKGIIDIELTVILLGKRNTKQRIITGRIRLPKLMFPYIVGHGQWWFSLVIKAWCARFPVFLPCPTRVWVVVILFLSDEKLKIKN